MKQSDTESVVPALSRDEFLNLLGRQIYLRGCMGFDIDNNVFVNIHLISIFEDVIGEVIYQDRTPAHFAFTQILRRTEDELEEIRKVMNYPLRDMSLNRKPVLFLWDSVRPTLEEREGFAFEEVPATEFHFLQHCARMACQAGEQLTMVSLVTRHGKGKVPLGISAWDEDFILAMKGILYRLEAFIDQQNRLAESALGSKIVTPEGRHRFDPKPPDIRELIKKKPKWIH